MLDLKGCHFAAARPLDEKSQAATEKIKESERKGPKLPSVPGCLRNFDCLGELLCKLKPDLNMQGHKISGETSSVQKLKVKNFDPKAHSQYLLRHLYFLGISTIF